MNHSDRILPGVALMIAFCVIAPLIDVSAKLASATLPVAEITFGRFVVQAALMAPVVLIMGLPFRISRRVLGLSLLRAVMSILATFCFVAAVAVMPIADALAIAFVEPFILLLLGKLLFSEQVGPRRLGASVVGFLGSLLVIQPSFAEFGPVAFYPLGTALFFALYMLVTRQLSRVVHPVSMQFQTAILAALICAPVLWLAEGSGLAEFDPVMPEGIFWFWLFCVGLAATISHMAMTYALQFAPSATLAPLHYLEIVSATFFGYLVFGDFPDALKWLGIAIITSSGLYIIHRERHMARSARLTVNPPAPEIR